MSTCGARPTDDGSGMRAHALARRARMTLTTDAARICGLPQAASPAPLRPSSPPLPHLRGVRRRHRSSPQISHGSRRASSRELPHAHRDIQAGRASVPCRPREYQSQLLSSCSSLPTEPPATPHEIGSGSSSPFAFRISRTTAAPPPAGGPRMPPSRVPGRDWKPPRPPPSPPPPPPGGTPKMRSGAP